MLYMNLSGLRDYLALSGVCSPADFGGFVTGFNRSTELFSIVDCGGESISPPSSTLVSFHPMHL